MLQKFFFALIIASLQGGYAYTPPGLPLGLSTSLNKGKGTISFRPVEQPPPVTVPWFPMSKKDLDIIGSKTLDAGAELDSDHPGFHDLEYRKRRKMIVDSAARYKFGEALPKVDYTATETETWGHVYKALREASKKYAISQFNEIITEMEDKGLYGESAIPQIGDISSYLKDKTGFTLRPVGGLLTARDFLNGLAFKVFHSTQYIRHESKPLYTPEPDVLHELVGHAPMLADPDFAALSHKFGLASIGATDAEVQRLATAYWFSVEFGLCMEGGKRKAYGAGLLSSIGELEYACTSVADSGSNPEYRKWDPKPASLQSYPITEYQPIYYVAESLRDAEARIGQFGEMINAERPFSIHYDEKNGCIITDPTVFRLPKDAAP